MQSAVGKEGTIALDGIQTMFQYILAHPRMDKGDLSHVKRTLWSTAPMPVSNALTRFHIPTHNVNSQTETTGSVKITDADCTLGAVNKYINRPEPNYCLRIVDADIGNAYLVEPLDRWANPGRRSCDAPVDAVTA